MMKALNNGIQSVNSNPTPKSLSIEMANQKRGQLIAMLMGSGMDENQIGVVKKKSIQSNQYNHNWNER